MKLETILLVCCLNFLLVLRAFFLVKDLIIASKASGSSPRPLPSLSPSSLPAASPFSSLATLSLSLEFSRQIASNSFSTSLKRPCNLALAAGGIAEEDDDLVEEGRRESDTSSRYERVETEAGAKWECCH